MTKVWSKGEISIQYRDESPDDLAICREVIEADVYRARPLLTMMSARKPQGFRIFDCGAHIGSFSTVAHHYAPNAEIHSFEMHPLNLALLRKNVGTFATVHPVCVTDVAYYKGEVSMADAFQSGHSGGSFIKYAPDIADPEVYREAPLEAEPMTLDQMIEQYGAPDFVKLDIEGQELVLFQTSTRLHEVGCLVGECHDSDSFEKVLAGLPSCFLYWLERCPDAPQMGYFYAWNTGMEGVAPRPSAVPTALYQEEPIRVYDRSLMPRDDRKPRLLVIGSREAAFDYPIHDFWQIDNWGNYLSYWFRGEYRQVTNTCGEEISWENYDLIVGTLDHNVVLAYVNYDWFRRALATSMAKKVFFLDGTLSMMGEARENREPLVELMGLADVVCAHQTHARSWARQFGVHATEISHIFPFRWFDHHYRGRSAHEGFTIMCAGQFDSHCHLTSFSLYVAARHADRVLMATHGQRELAALQASVPKQVELFQMIPQEKLYADVLPDVDLLLKMDNPAGVGRAIADAAAAGIPAIASKDVFQIRCFPELLLPAIDEVEMVESLIETLRNDPDYRRDLGIRGRERLKASNEAEFETMRRALQGLGFEVKRPKELYW